MEIDGRAHGDRRRRKTREAVFSALTRLLEERPYDAITASDIIREADVGRTTFYAHFETKDDLVREMCDELFGHVVEAARDGARGGGSVFAHLLWHLREDDRGALALLSGGGGPFPMLFRERLEGLVRGEVAELPGVPEGFLVNQVAGGFVEMARWWVRGGLERDPDELDRWFRRVMVPALRGQRSDGAETPKIT